MHYAEFAEDDVRIPLHCLHLERLYVGYVLA